MIYAEGRNESWNGKPTRASYEDTITVVPHLKYELQIEVLRNDLGHPSERVSDITMNGVGVGGCNPDGDDYDCSFYNCTSSLDQTTVSSDTASIKAIFHFQGHSSDCDCDKNTWECSKENTKPDLTPMTAVARITLTPIHGRSLTIVGQMYQHFYIVT